MTLGERSGSVELVRLHRASLIAALMLTLVTSTSFGLYLASIGPAECCRSHCRCGSDAAGDDADRCCATHLGVVPAGLGATATDVQHTLTVSLATIPAVVLPWPAMAPAFPGPATSGRASPLLSLLASHTALLI